MNQATDPDGSPVPPAADRIEDVRDRLRDPAAARDILDLDGLNPRVQDIVLATPGARELLANLADLPAGPRRIAIGCAGGRHRPVDRTMGGHVGRERIPARASTASTTGRWHRTAALPGCAGSRPEPAGWSAQCGACAACGVCRPPDCGVPDQGRTYEARRRGDQ
ncbi:RapZ C-terminal domain-containing protein [Streptomyces avermitilis]